MVSVSTLLEVGGFALLVTCLIVAAGWAVGFAVLGGVVMVVGYLLGDE